MKNDTRGFSLAYILMQEHTHYIYMNADKECGHYAFKIYCGLHVYLTFYLCKLILGFQRTSRRKSQALALPTKN